MLDPTVEDQAPVREALQSLAAEVPEGGELVVWLLDEQMVASSSPHVFTYPFLARERTDVAHRDRVSNDLRTVAAEFTAAWRRAHEASANERPKSCVLTALFVVGNYIDERAPERRHNRAVVVSNLLEVCSDWGPRVNLEQSLRVTKTLADGGSKQAIHLQNVAALSFLRVPDSHVQRPAELLHLRALWLDAAKEFGLQRNPSFSEVRGSAVATVKPDTRGVKGETRGDSAATAVDGPT